MEYFGKDRAAAAQVAAQVPVLAPVQVLAAA